MRLVQWRTRIGMDRTSSSGFILGTSAPLGLLGHTRNSQDHQQSTRAGQKSDQTSRFSIRQQSVATKIENWPKVWKKRTLYYIFFIFSILMYGRWGGYHLPPTLQANWCGNDLIKGKYPVSCPIVPCHECHDTHVTVSWHASTDWLVFYCKN